MSLKSKLTDELNNAKKYFKHKLNRSGIFFGGGILSKRQALHDEMSLKQTQLKRSTLSDEKTLLKQEILSLNQTILVLNQELQEHAKKFCVYTNHEEKIVSLFYLKVTIAEMTYEAYYPIANMMLSKDFLYEGIIQKCITTLGQVDEQICPEIDCGIILEAHPSERISITKETSPITLLTEQIEKEVNNAIAYVQLKIGTPFLQNSQSIDPNYFIIRMTMHRQAPYGRDQYQFNYPLSCELVTLEKSPTMLIPDSLRGLYKNYYSYALYADQLFYIHPGALNITQNQIQIFGPRKTLTSDEFKTLKTLFPSEADIEKAALMRKTTLKKEAEVIREKALKETNIQEKANLEKAATDKEKDPCRLDGWKPASMETYKTLTSLIGDEQAFKLTTLSTKQCIKEIMAILSSLTTTEIQKIQFIFGVSYPVNADLSEEQRRHNCFVPLMGFPPVEQPLTQKSDSDTPNASFEPLLRPPQEESKLFLKPNSPAQQSNPSTGTISSEIMPQRSPCSEPIPFIRNSSPGTLSADSALVQARSPNSLTGVGPTLPPPEIKLSRSYDRISIFSSISTPTSPREIATAPEVNPSPQEFVYTP